MAESTHGKLSRVRKPRVHITYDVDGSDGPMKKELPFVVGVMGDFSGNPTQPLKRLDERKFISIDRDNFNDVMVRMSPGLDIRVENTLQGDGEMAVHLEFNSMDDFEPGNVVQQVEPLKKLLDARNDLRDLLTSVDRSPDAEEILEKALQATQSGGAAPAAEASGDTNDSDDSSKGGDEE